MFASHCTLFYLHVTQHNNLFGCTKCFYFNPFQSIENLKLVRATLTKILIKQEGANHVL